MSSGNPQESAVNVKPSIAVGRALSLLDAFLDAGHTMSLTELAQLTSLPKSTAFRILGQLTASGHVIRNGNQYRLGIKMFELGNHFVHSRPTGLKEVAAPLLGDLFLHVGATVDCPSSNRGTSSSSTRSRVHAAGSSRPSSEAGPRP
ncbi:hypothetical protein NJ76_16445 [Rhodococcus sp. IITR03]|nr:hypothetical protein NJ76_16445 [Rhodococcus sp. IITR03]